MSVIDFPPRRLRPDILAGMTREHRAFCLARQALNQCLLNWLRAGGDLALIEEEIDPTQDVMKQLIKLERPHAAG